MDAAKAARLSLEKVSHLGFLDARLQPQFRHTSTKILYGIASQGKAKLLDVANLVRHQFLYKNIKIPYSISPQRQHRSLHVVALFCHVATLFCTCCCLFLNPVPLMTHSVLVPCFCVVVANLSAGLFELAYPSDVLRCAARIASWSRLPSLM